MFGGILEITKESEDIFVFNLPSLTWKLIDMTEPPQNLETFFSNFKKVEPSFHNRAVSDSKIAKLPGQTSRDSKSSPYFTAQKDFNTIVDQSGFVAAN
jgi:hypothetical protein